MRLDEVEMKRQSLFGDSRLSATWMLLSSTDRWPQRPALLNPGAVEKGGAGAYVEYLCHSAVGLKQNQLSAYSCFLQYPPLFCRYPLCRNHYALIYCSSVASRLLWLSFGFLSSSTDPLIPLFSLHPIFSLSLSLSECRVLSASYWLPFFFPLSILLLSCSSACWIKPELGHRLHPPWACWGNQSWDCLKRRGVTGSKRGCTNTCVFGSLG